jgi:hypothetical protein
MYIATFTSSLGCANNQLVVFLNHILKTHPEATIQRLITLY